MLRTATRNRPYEARMLAAADRLFTEFDGMPVLTVIRAMTQARSEVRDQSGVASPEAVEEAARTRLRQGRLD